MSEEEDIPMDGEKAVNFIRKNARALSKAKAHRSYMEEYKKSLKAILMKRSMENSIGAQEREALSHKEYIAHLKAIEEAMEKEEYLRWKMVAAQAMSEVWRSQEASNRAIDRAAM